jgi:hypothetical protein
MAAATRTRRSRAAVAARTSLGERKESRGSDGEERESGRGGTGLVAGPGWQWDTGVRGHGEGADERAPAERETAWWARPNEKIEI